MVAQTRVASSAEAGAQLAEEVREQLHSDSPDALIVFASSRYDYEDLLRPLSAACQPGVLVGCSSAGEFTRAEVQEGSACAVALRSDDLLFHAGLGRGLRTDRATAAREIVDALAGPRHPEYRYRSALVLADALAGFTDDLVSQLHVLTGGTCTFFGGGAGDDANFIKTHVFFGTGAYTDAVVALEILSNKPLGIGVRHGWQPASEPLRVTEAKGTRLVSLDATPAVEVFDEHAGATSQTFDHDNPVPFFLHNVIGVETPAGHKLRVPLAVQPDGTLACASDVPVSATARIMSTSTAAGVAAARTATDDALRQLGGARPEVALFFDCVATRLRMGSEFGDELTALESALGDAKVAGCNTYGQIAHAEGQFSGFHNCTAVVCLIPE